jgi:PPOX class probable FMN-dependent enzyme
MNFIQTSEQLRALFGATPPNALRKETDHLHPVYQQWIQSSGFAVLATSGPTGLDTSPRGDPVPLVKIIDEKTLVLPERKGNNRIDSLLNILHDPRVSLIFLVPGVDETLRVNGSARITADPELLQSLAVNGRPPACALWIHVDQVFFQCGKSMMRSGLWQQRAADAPQPPSAGEILAALSSGAIDAAQYEQEKPQRLRDGMY